MIITFTFDFATLVTYHCTQNPLPKSHGSRQAFSRQRREAGNTAANKTSAKSYNLALFEGWFESSNLARLRMSDPLTESWTKYQRAAHKASSGSVPSPGYVCPFCKARPPFSRADQLFSHAREKHVEQTIRQQLWRSELEKSQWLESCKAKPAYDPFSPEIRKSLIADSLVGKLWSRTLLTMTRT